MIKPGAHELIGECITVIKSSNKSLEGLKGRVVDETKFTLSIETSKGLKKILKKEATLQVGKSIINGELLVGKIEERIKSKKRLMRRW